MEIINRILERYKVSITFYEVITILFTLYLTLYLFGRGLFFVLVTREEVTQSDWYTKLDSVISIHLWGAIPITAAVLLFSSIFSKSLRAYVAFTIGNALGAIAQAVYAMTGVEYGLNWFTPYTNLLNLNFHVLLTVLGVYMTWKKRNRM